MISEKTPEIATCRILLAAKDSAAAWISATATGAISRPSNSKPPLTMWVSARSAAAMSSGQPESGGSDCVAGSARRSTPTRASDRRSTIALVKCVVPIITARRSAARTPEPEMTWRRTASTPASTSAEVAVFTAWTTSSPFIRTASVLVPPTSIPIRYMVFLVSQKRNLPPMPYWRPSAREPIA